MYFAGTHHHQLQRMTLHSKKRSPLFLDCNEVVSHELKVFHLCILCFLVLFNDEIEQTVLSLSFLPLLLVPKPTVNVEHKPLKGYQEHKRRYFEKYIQDFFSFLTFFFSPVLRFYE